MGDKSDEKNDEIKDRHAENSCVSREKSLETSERENSGKASKFSSSNGSIASLLSVVEKTIKELYNTITRRITDFLNNDLPQLKNLSKDELKRLNTSLSEYTGELEKLSNEKMKRVGEIKDALRTRILTGEEVKNFVKYIDVRITRMRNITENIVNTLRKSEATNNLVKELQSVVKDYGKRMNSAVNDLYIGLKEMAGVVGRSATEKEKIATKIPKMPTTSELEKIPSMLSKTLKRMGKTDSRTCDEPAKKISLPPVSRLREILPNLNLGKHFNSETMYGRANVAKATYAGALLYFLWWKMKSSKS